MNYECIDGGIGTCQYRGIKDLIDKDMASGQAGEAMSQAEAEAFAEEYMSGVGEYLELIDGLTTDEDKEDANSYFQEGVHPDVIRELLAEPSLETRIHRALTRFFGAPAVKANDGDDVTVLLALCKRYAGEQQSEPLDDPQQDDYKRRLPF